MRLALYYICHTFKNQLRKIFKTWVAVFFAVCLVLGVVVGLGAGFIVSLSDDTSSSSSETVSDDSSVQPSEDDEIILTHEEIAEVQEIFELAVGGIALLVFVLHILTGQKSGSSIFLMPDVNLLFSAPIKPQSVLMFRLVMQMGSMIAASIYLLFQIPNLCVNLGLGVWSALGLFAVWLFITVYSKLLSVLVYTFASSGNRSKRLIRPLTYGAISVIGVAFFLYMKINGVSVYTAAKSFFNADITRYIPIWGWVKGASVGAVSGDPLRFFVYVAVMIAGAVAMSWLIWRIKADFYEEALQKSSETAEAIQAAADNGAMVVRRKKERSEKLKRDGFSKGFGANVYFHKAIYNRARFAKLGLFNATVTVYLCLSLAVSLALKFVFEYQNIFVVACVIGAVAFFRSLGNPISQDIRQSSFFLIPESAYKKMFYSLLGGTATCLLDLIPAFAVAYIILGGNILHALLYLVFITAVDFYSSNVGVFLDVSMSTSIAKTIRNVIQIMIIYAGILPIIGIMAVGFFTGKIIPFTGISIMFCLMLGVLFSVISPRFVERGLR